MKNCDLIVGQKKKNMKQNNQSHDKNYLEMLAKKFAKSFDRVLRDSVSEILQNEIPHNLYSAEFILAKFEKAQIWLKGAS